MKAALSIFLLVFAANVSLAQEVFLEKLKAYDLSQVIHPDSIIDKDSEKHDRPEILGYIGNYQRFRIHFTSFVKSKENPLKYNVKGKTNIKDNICNFAGTIEIVSAKSGNIALMEHMGVPNFEPLSLLCNVKIYEDKSQIGTGLIKGKLVTNVVFDDKKILRYDAVMYVTDIFRNNQFTGTWTSYKNGISKKCNWGDYRIPESGDLDVGAGEFSVLEKYKNKGWESYYDAYCCDPDLPKTKAARKKEEEKWWL